ncbi:MAG: DUF3160 domain-containing protein, partial [Fibromonadaceae bacterium]|nr:DUF3160 domain-containing protein [Fibromonadaceae bacterium]
MTKKKAIIAAAIFVTLAVISVTAWKISSAGKEAENAGQTSEAATEPATDEIIENISGSFDNSDFIGDYEALRKKKRFNSLKVLFNELKNDYLGKIDFEQDLSSLSMKDLLMLRSSIYAVNGLFFKEENLYSYFMDVKNPLIPWYMNYMCFFLFYEERENSKAFAEKEKDVNLNDAEKAFVERLDGRIAELRNKDMYISKSDYTIGNTAHIVNMHKVKNLNKSYTDKLAQNNFAIVDLDTGHLQLFHVYEQNAYKDMPSFVTTDLFLQAFHMYLSYTLKKLEQEKFAPALEDLTLSLYKASMDLSKSENGELAQMAEYNAAFYAIAYTLLTGKELNIPARYKDSYYEETSRAKAAEEDEQESNFLGGEVMHYTLFKPRGHYTRKPETEAYFKAMIWLQKAYFCRDSSAHLKQSIFTASLLNTAKSENNRSLMDVYASIFEPTALLIGEPNNLSIMDIAEFLKRENIKDMSLALSAENIEKTNQMLAALAKRILIKPKFQMTCPDKINFMPQRYLIDNEVLQELADTSLNAERAFPKGLDVFSAFGSAPASDLLNNFYKEKEKWSKYPEEMDKLQNKFGSFDGWNKSVHNKWIQSLLTLQKRDKSYPAFMKTKAWDYKNLNTSLASWAELKHDFILYADQPMAAEYGGAGYWLPSPDVTVGYVEPNILFWN